MERPHGLPLTGPGLGALDPDPDPGTLEPGSPPAPDLAAEPAGFMVAMDGAVRIHFLDWGGPDATPAAPGVLLIHGLARTAWAWTPVARRLRGRAHVVAMDLRGHGLSDAPTDGYDPGQLAEDTIAVAEGAGLLPLTDEPHLPGARGGTPGPPRFVVAGHGFGAVVATWTARALGGRCAGLVLVDGGWTDLPAETGSSPAEWLAAIAEPPAVLGSMGAWLADREAFDPATWDADQERAARAEVVETAAGRVKPAIHGHALAASVGALWSYTPASVLPVVEAEVVALVARDDDDGRHVESLREVAAARLAAGRSPIRAASFPGLGHDLVRHVPDAVVAAIEALLGPADGAGAAASG